MRIRIEFDAHNRRDLRFFLSRLVDMNRYLIKTRRLPRLYEAGIRYRREPSPPVGERRIERWNVATEAVKKGHSDCEDLASYRVAELRLAGEPAQIRLKKKGRVWHVTVRRADGRIEDPSKRLGM